MNDILLGSLATVGGLTVVSFVGVGLMVLADWAQRCRLASKINRALDAVEVERQAINAEFERLTHSKLSAAFGELVRRLKDRA